ncbi:MAG: hypothetical protein ABJ084_03790 [Halioglobus sp.]
MSIDGLLEASFVTWGNVISLLALLITLISGYLVVAYIAGAKMTRAQVTLINILYVLMSAFLIWACREMAWRAAVFEDTAYSMATGPVSELYARGDVALAIISSFGLALLASFKFMWDVRHPKTE